MDTLETREKDLTLTKRDTSAFMAAIFNWVCGDPAPPTTKTQLLLLCIHEPAFFFASSYPIPLETQTPGLTWALVTSLCPLSLVLTHFGEQHAELVGTPRACVSKGCWCPKTQKTGLMKGHRHKKLPGAGGCFLAVSRLPKAQASGDLSGEESVAPGETGSRVSQDACGHFLRGVKVGNIGAEGRSAKVPLQDEKESSLTLDTQACLEFLKMEVRESMVNHLVRSLLQGNSSFLHEFLKNCQVFGTTQQVLDLLLKRFVHPLVGQGSSIWLGFGNALHHLVTQFAV
ncbi:uncharacterized protein LOC110344965 [Heterocephalus glaber]|uniref:Uncharacterized protein LOC110344965 n=1 Tax=Heterocephalus glaber TaxID=10181 RepID=A0AAX6RIT1_HETGA|nr:uncharacterized protein LOC110344965 [Heterocephalus glaber]